jgi:Mg2+ and Co2+ transporter CorA
MQSLFGMNVDLLKDNPDWRWYVPFGGAFLIITFVIWLIFKFNPVSGIFSRVAPFVVTDK